MYAVHREVKDVISMSVRCAANEEKCLKLPRVAAVKDEDALLKPCYY